MTEADKSLAEQKQQASAWFESLRDDLCAAFERLEADLPAGAPLSDRPPARFERTPWARADHAAADGGADGGGGVMSLIRGRVFEKAGIHTSTVHGEFAPELRKQIPGAEEDPRFWASGVSLIAHPVNPHAPTAHMNTRMVVTSKWWFGGGGDLTPDAGPAADPGRPRHAGVPCRHGSGLPRDMLWRTTRASSSGAMNTSTYPIAARRAGVGGIFYDYLTPGEAEGGWEAAFAFTQDVGRAFLRVYPEIVRRNFAQSLERRPSATSNLCAAAAMWSSTCSTTAAPRSASRPAATWRRSSPRCRRW